MSTCPEKTIHSVYVDGELPAKLVAKYEEHVAGCVECQKTVERLRKLKNRLHDNLDTLEFSDKEMDSSFDRLQIKLSYHKITGANKPSSGKFAALKYISTGVAAAAAVAFILPLTMTKKSTAPVTEKENTFELRSFSASAVKPTAKETLHADGTLNAEELSSVFADDNTAQNENQNKKKIIPLTPDPSKKNRGYTGLHLSNYDMFMRSPDTVSNVPGYDQFTEASFSYYEPITVSSSIFDSGNIK